MKVNTDGVLLGSWANVNNATTILDIGSGTGVIALMLAQRSPIAVVHAVEIDALAVESAKENVLNSPWSSRVEVFLLQLSVLCECSQTTLQPYRF